MASVPISGLRALMKELRVSGRDQLVVGGASELAPILRRELGRDAHPGAVRSTDDPRGAAVYVHVYAGSVDDEAQLKRARKARVPIVAVVSGELPDEIPYVLATDVVQVAPGHGFPVQEIAKKIAHRLGEDAVALAARMPVLRRAVADALITLCSRKNAIFAAAIFIPGADLPVLTLNQIRMVLRIEQAYGLDPNPRERVPELVATFAAGLGLRAVARGLLSTVPVAGWAVKSGIAYTGTRALGEAARLRVEAMPPPAGASRAAP